MTPLWVHHFDRRRGWSLVYFLIYAYLNISACCKFSLSVSIYTSDFNETLRITNYVAMQCGQFPENWVAIVMFCGAIFPAENWCFHFSQWIWQFQASFKFFFIRVNERVTMHKLREICILSTHQCKHCNPALNVWPIRKTGLGLIFTEWKPIWFWSNIFKNSMRVPCKILTDNSHIISKYWVRNCLKN